MPLDLFAAKRLSDQTQNDGLVPSFWSDFIPCAPHASVLTALRHSGRAFTAHVAESAGCAQGALPLDPARGIMPLNPLLLYNIAPSVAGKAATLGALLLKHEQVSPSTTALFVNHIIL